MVSVSETDITCVEERGRMMVVWSSESQFVFGRDGRIAVLDIFAFCVFCTKLLGRGDNSFQEFVSHIKAKNSV